VWARLTAGLAGLPVAAPTAGALAQARRRVGVAPPRWLSGLLRGPAAVVTYQILRTAMADATASVPGTDPARASFTIAWQTARDQLIRAAA
jgi:hypothetical protein